MVPDQVLVSCLLPLGRRVSLTFFRLYMLDGLYQSVICFYMPYLLFKPATFATATGLNINDGPRMGVLVASAAVIASNTYILLNTYRWDWLTVLINAISSLLIFFWTGIYSSSPASGKFYKAASQVYGALSFWVVLLLTVMICLLPRFAINSIQKVFFPMDVDIIREQQSQGYFKHLDSIGNLEDLEPPKESPTSGGSSGGSASSSDLGKPVQPSMKQDPFIADEERTSYSPSEAHTKNTHNRRSQNGSNGTYYTSSLDTTQQPYPQPVDNVRHSADRTRHSFEAGDDFPSANMLSRVESSNSTMQVPQSPPPSLHSPLKGVSDPPTHPA